MQLAGFKWEINKLNACIRKDKRFMNYCLTFHLKKLKAEKSKLKRMN